MSCISYLYHIAYYIIYDICRIYHILYRIISYIISYIVCRIYRIIYHMIFVSAPMITSDLAYISVLCNFKLARCFPSLVNRMRREFNFTANTTVYSPYQVCVTPEL